MSKKLLTPLSALCISMFSAHALSQSSNDDSTITYPSAYFAEYVPITVNDMLNRIPGINLVLNNGGAGSNSSSDRGLGSSAQILIDGKRLAGKANEATSQLDRIAANEVDYIEIIRGSSSDLDVQNSGQLVNIVLLESQSRSTLSTEANATRFADGTVEPGGSLAWSGQSGNLTYLLSGTVATAYEHVESYEYSLNADFSPNDTIAFDRYRDQTNYTLNSNVSYALTENDRIAFNALYSQNDPQTELYRIVTDLNGPSPVVSYEREDIPSTSDNWEIGGDYEHSFNSGNRFKVLFIANEKNTDILRERFLSFTPGGTETKNLFLSTQSRYSERIARSSHTMTLREGQGLELGIEAAQTVQDSALKQGVPRATGGNPAYGGLTPVMFPNANSTVEEVRYEPFAIHNWQITPRMSLESSLVAEFSEIEQSADTNLKRDFQYLKPKLDYRFNISGSLQFRASLEREVSQLSFADFSRSTNDRDDDQDTIAGNPQLEPEESLKGEVTLDYRLPNDGGSLNARYFHYEYDNKIGKVDISTPTVLQSTNGNIGSAATYGIILNGSVKLGFVGLPQALLTAAATIQESEFHDDPMVPVEHGFPPYDRGTYRVSYRHDLPQYRMNYGLTYNGRWSGGRILYEIDNRYNLAVPNNFTAYVEIVGFAGLTYRLEANNLSNHESRPKRVRYAGKTIDAVPEEYEFTRSTTGTSFAFKVRGNF
ncbi:TonB-dependent receptor plug domain-containing protein [Pseudohongiella acticola]|jgi:outer membrane receptor for ferrienterochelin and colicins|uniref:TonB-dependent receptor plug domain-containing protein n=1 Tax=Pseudohongiella acticola TaxID=1524254 RepID=UPI0030EF30D2